MKQLWLNRGFYVLLRFETQVGPRIPKMTGKRTWLNGIIDAAKKNLIDETKSQIKEI